MKHRTIGLSRHLLVLLTMGAMTALAASAQKAEGVGYWMLAYNKVYQEDGKVWGGVPINN